jgi:hypothetical protein
MLFGWGRSTAAIETDEAGEAAEAPPYELAVIELRTVTGSVMGWIATEGERTSDWLNSRPRIPLHGLVDAARVSADAPLPPPPDGTATPTEVARDEVIWVVPPPLPPNRHLRLHRRRVLVHLELDEWEVSGQAHVRPGADAIDQVMRGSRDMVPLTDVQVVSRTDPDQGCVLPVLVVNRRHVGRVVEDRPHASSAVPGPVATPSSDGVSDPRLAWLLPDETEPADQPADPPTAAESDEGEGPPESSGPPSGPEATHAALSLLLEAGVIDVVEFQSIRARIGTLPAD